MNATFHSFAASLPATLGTKRSLAGLALAVLAGTAAHAAPADHGLDRYRAEQGAAVSSLSPGYQALLATKVNAVDANADLSIDRYRAEQGAARETLSPAYRAAWAADHRGLTTTYGDSGYARYRAEQGDAQARQALDLQAARAAAAWATAGE